MCWKIFSKTQINTVPTTNKITVTKRATTEHSVNLLGNFVLVITPFSSSSFFDCPYIQGRIIEIAKGIRIAGNIAKSISILLLLSCETNDTLNVGQESKRSQNRSKTGVVKPKGIFYASIAATITDKNAIIKVPISQTFQ